MRFLILAHIGDETALRVSVALRARHGAEQVKLVSSEELAFASNWAHRLEDLRVSTDVLLGDGTSLDTANIGVVFNRLFELRIPRLAFASEADRDYTLREMNALCLSWLASLPCPVVNAATPMGLSAQTRSRAEWLFLAGKAGLPVKGYHFTSDPRWCREKTYLPYRWRSGSEYNPPTVFAKVSEPLIGRQPTFYLEAVSEHWQSILLAGNIVLGSLARIYSEQVTRLAKIAGCDLLEIMFARVAIGQTNQITSGDWRVCGVNPFPHVQSAKSVSAIVDLLEAKHIEYQPDWSVRR